MKFGLIFSCFLVILVISLIALELGDAARGSSSRGGSRFRSSTSTKSRSSSISKVRYYRGPSYSRGMWKTAAAAGVVFGIMAYQRRSLYHRYPNREPRICFNGVSLRNGTYGYFICPEPGTDDDYDYCCGDEGEQYCCRYSDASAGGRTAGIVVGVIAVCVIVGVIVFCVVKKRQQRSKHTAVLNTNKPGGGTYVHEQQPLTHNYNTSSGGDIPMQSYQPGLPPQGYDASSQGLPYSTPPGGPGYYPPPQGEGFGAQVMYPSDPGPYPAQPPPPGFLDGKEPLPPGDVSCSSNPPYPPGSYPPTTGPYNMPSGQPPPYPAN